MKILVKNGRVVDPASGHDAPADVAIAAGRISRRQMDRICQAALLFTDRLPAGSLTELRFDAALVDAAGRVEIVENAFGLN